MHDAFFQKQQQEGIIISDMTLGDARLQPLITHHHIQEHQKAKMGSWALEVVELRAKVQEAV